MTFVLPGTLLSSAGQVVWLQQASNCQMKSQPRVRSPLIALLLFTGPLIALSTAQSKPKLLASTDSPAIVRSVRLLSGPAVEILSNRPIVPDISKLDNPPRLVIDLPNADLPNADLSK